MNTPICSICKQPIRLETAKTDENGKAVHEDCYLQHLMAMLQGGGRSTPNNSPTLLGHYRCLQSFRDAQNPAPGILSGIS